MRENEMKLLIILLIGLSSTTANNRSKRSLRTIVDSAWEYIHWNRLSNITQTYLYKTSALPMLIHECRRPAVKHLLRWIIDHPTFESLNEYCIENDLDLRDLLKEGWDRLNAVETPENAPLGTLKEYHDALVAAIDYRKLSIELLFQILDDDFTKFYTMLQRRTTQFFGEKIIGSKVFQRLIRILEKNGVAAQRYVDFVYDILLWSRN